MRILIPDICGYVSSEFAVRFARSVPGLEIIGIDDLSRRGSGTDLDLLKKNGVKVRHADLRLKSDLRALPPADWVVYCSANPAVSAGVTAAGDSTPEQAVEHNLTSALNLLQYCKQHTAGIVIISTSRVYSIRALNRLPLKETLTRFEPDAAVAETFPAGFSVNGIAEEFSTMPPVSMHGAATLATETMALEYGEAFNFPVWINRCGVMGGSEHFGAFDQSIFSFWVHSIALNRPLAYIGFKGAGKQVCDCIIPEDVADLALMQMRKPGTEAPRILNVGGGTAGALSLCETTKICESYFKRFISVPPSALSRPDDIAYYVSDIGRARKFWGWQPSKTGEEIVRDLCLWTSENPDYARNP